MSGFAHCKEDAIELSREIPGSGIAYGMYIPDTPKAKWDPGWKLDTPAFIHFWVEKEDTIYDSGSEQFGGKPLEVVDSKDERYIRVGKYIPEGDIVTPEVTDPIINWGTFVGPEKPVYVTWNNPPERLGLW